jgi:hypothetical protein
MRPRGDFSKAFNPESVSELNAVLKKYGESDLNFKELFSSSRPTLMR